MVGTFWTSSSYTSNLKDVTDVSDGANNSKTHALRYMHRLFKAIFFSNLTKKPGQEKKCPYRDCVHFSENSPYTHTHTHIYIYIYIYT